MSARESRRRKKEYIHSLQQKVRDLEAELAELKKRTTPYTKEQLIEEKKRIVDRLQQLLKEREMMPKGRKRALGEDSATAEIVGCLREIRKLGTDDVWLMMQHHFSKIHELLIPFPFVKFILWGLDQRDDFFEADASGKLQGVWGLLVQQLGFTEEQQQQLISMRSACATQRKEITGLVSNLKSLNEKIRKKLEELMILMRNMQDILTPPQQIKFLHWAENNEAAMSMVDAIWNADTGVSAKEYNTPLSQEEHGSCQTAEGVSADAGVQPTNAAVQTDSPPRSESPISQLPEQLSSNINSVPSPNMS